MRTKGSYSDGSYEVIQGKKSRAMWSIDRDSEVALSMKMTLCIFVTFKDDAIGQHSSVSRFQML